MPGDSITAGGILKIEACEEGIQRTDNSFSFFLKALFVNVQSKKDQWDLPEEIPRSLQSTEGLFAKACASFAPHLRGMKSIKGTPSVITG